MICHQTLKQPRGLSGISESSRRPLVWRPQRPRVWRKVLPSTACDSMAQDRLAMMDENGRPTVSRTQSAMGRNYATQSAMGHANNGIDAAADDNATPRSLAREAAHSNDGQDTAMHGDVNGDETHRQAVEPTRTPGGKGKRAVEESQRDAPGNTSQPGMTRTMSRKDRATVLSHLRHATSSPNMKGLAPLLHPDPLGPGLKLRLRSIEENGFAKSPAPEEIEQWLAALRTSLSHLLGDGTKLNGNAVSHSSEIHEAVQEQDMVQRLIDAMPVPPGQNGPSRRHRSIGRMRDEAEQVVMSAVSRDIPDALAAQQLHRLSVAMSDADGTYTDVETMRAEQDTKPHNRPAASHRKRSSLRTPIPEEHIDPSKTGSSLRPSNGRPKQSSMPITSSGSRYTASERDSHQRHPTPTRSRASSIQPYRSAISPTPDEWSMSDTIEDNLAKAVEGTLSVIREHREYLDKSRAVAKRSEDILARLAQTPTASWRAKQKSSLGPYSPAAKSTAKAQTKPTVPSVPSHAAPPPPYSRIPRGRPATAMSNTTDNSAARLSPSVARSRSGARRRRRSASTGSIRSRSSTAPPPRRRSRSLTGNTGRLVDDYLNRLRAGELPHVDKVKAENSRLQRSAGLPSVKEQMISEAAAEASRHSRVLLDATLPAQPLPLAPRYRRSSSRLARLQGRDPPPVPRMSSARGRVKQSTFARTARPDHFAPKPEINTRISDRSLENTRRTRQPSDADSISRSVLSDPREPRPSSASKMRRDIESATPRGPASPVPAWHRLSQQSTASWSSKGKAPMRDEEHNRGLRTMLDTRSRSSVRSSLLSPSSARISFVGEDFDTAMEGSIRDRSFNSQRYMVDDSKLSDKMRQDSGPDGNGGVALPRDNPHAQQSALVQGLDLASPMENDDVVTIWREEVGWLFSVANQKRLSEYKPLTVPLKRVKAKRSSSKIAVPSQEEFQAMIDRANEMLRRKRLPEGQRYRRPAGLTSYGMVTHRRESTSLRSKTKNAINRCLTLGNKLGNTLLLKSSKSRGRRGSTGSLMERPIVITPGMADDGKVVAGRPVLSHANSLRPDHNPALLRAKGMNGQPPSRTASKSSIKRTAQPSIRSSLATHAEESEEEAGPAELGSTAVHEMPAKERASSLTTKASEDTIRVWHAAGVQWVRTQEVEKATVAVSAVPASPVSPL